MSNRYAFSTRKLEELCEINIGKTPSRSNPVFWNGSHPWLSIADMNQGRNLIHTKERITTEGIVASGIKEVTKGTLLLSYKLSIGKVGIAQENIYTNEAIAALPILDSSVLNINFLYWALKTIDLLENSDKAAMGKTLNKAKLKQLQIPLPPLAEQKRIAGILDAAEALRAKRLESLAQLDTLLQSTFFDMFGDPVTNPMGFPIKTLAEFYVSKRDGTKCGPFGSALKKHELVESGVPVWNMANIDPIGRMALPFRMWITEDKYRQLEAYSVFDGDVIISRAGTVGKMCVANSGCAASIISTNLIRVRFGNDLLPIYFVSLMNYCKGRVGRLKTGPDGSFTHMSTGVLDKLKFPYPPRYLQHRFAVFVEAVEQQKASQRSHLAELDMLFASVQQSAFNGEL